MKLLSAAVTADLTDDAVAVLQRMLMHGRAHVAEIMPRHDLAYADLHALAGDLYQLSRLRTYVSDAEHPGRVGKITFVDRGHIDIDDIAVLQNHVRGGNTVADLIVQRGADALRKSLIVQRCRDAAHLLRRLIDDPVDLLRTHPLTDTGGHLVEHGDIDLRAGPDSFDILRRLEKPSFRHFMSLHLRRPDLLVKGHMALLILSSASAPARFVAVQFWIGKFHGIPLPTMSYLTAVQGCVRAAGLSIAPKRRKVHDSGY